MVLVELPDRLDHRDPKVKKERKVILESKDPRVIPAQLELRARRAIQERKDHKATKVFLVKMRIMLRLSEVITITHQMEKTRGCG